MTENRTQALFDRFPTFFNSHKSLFESPMAFGFECGDGWSNLIYSLCKDIELALEPNDEFEVKQVKEKFGGLRFYYSGGNEKINKLVDEAEEKSYTICEMCGKPGKLIDDGWLQTLCHVCYGKQNGG